MVENMDNNEDILDLACDCGFMRIVKTHWYGENAGRRFRESGEEECGYHMWVDPPLGAQAVAVIEELQERNLQNLQRSSRRMDRLIEKHEVRMNNMRMKQDFTVIAMFVLYMVLGAVGQEAVVDDDGYSSLDD